MPQADPPDSTADSTALSTAPPADPPRERQRDPSNPGRTVAYKKQNQAFLVHQQWREQQQQQQQQAAAAAKKKKKIKGKANADSSDDADDGVINLPSLFQVVKALVIALCAVLAVGHLVTGDVLYGYQGRWRNPRRWFPVTQRTFTPGELALYNGRDDSRPVYLSILGNVYDVSAGGPTYRPGGSYAFFAGTDASRAYVTGCFAKHLTHDLRGLSDDAIDKIRMWDAFFANHPRYFKVGTLRLPEIDEGAPLPEDC